MSRVWLVAKYHFRQEVSKRSFIFVLLSLPLFLSLSIGVGYLSVTLQQENPVLGYVDPAGFLVDTALDSEDDVELVPFQTREDAQVALEEERIEAYYVLAADFADTRHAELVFFEYPHYSAGNYFADVVRLNLMTDQPPVVINRLLSGADLTVQSIESGREYPAGGPNVGQFIPIAGAIVFAFLILTTSGYMMEVIVAEKENRTMEIMVSSISPARMMAGKIIGALGIGLLQLVVWLAFLAGAVWVGRSVLNIEWLQNLEVNAYDVLALVVVALPTYLFISAMMTLFSTTLVESQEAQQIGPLFFLLIFSPVYLIVPISQNLNGALALGLSFFPMTSMMTIGFRSLFMVIPVWQVAVSAAISLAGGIVLTWLAGKAFRFTMLRYGQRLRLRELFESRRSASGPA